MRDRSRHEDAHVRQTPRPAGPPGEERDSDGDRGAALVMALLLALAVAGVAVGAVLVANNANMMGRYNDRHAELEAIAHAGLEEARAQLNANADLFPEEPHDTLENRAQVTDASGNVIQGVRRSIYVGPRGISSGQYGVYGAAVVVAEDNFGNRVVRRQDLYQETFARFAYFTNNEPWNIAFGGGDILQGPVHSNDEIKIYDSGATFKKSVTTPRYIQNKDAGTFEQGYNEDADTIPLPETAEFNDLRQQAQAANYVFSATSSADEGEAELRIDFVTRDLNNDGDVQDGNEGFFRVYRSSDTDWVVGNRPSDYDDSSDSRLRNSRTCGHWHGGSENRVVTADEHAIAGPDPSESDDWTDAVTSPDAACFVGGADTLSGGFNANDGTGQYVQYPLTPHAAVSGEPDEQYLFPLSRDLNPNFKGVIHVDGDVAVRGTVRGRVTLSATGDINIVDDVRYATDPSSQTCRDILGMFAGDDIVLTDNAIQNPPEPYNSYDDYRTMDETPEETIHASLLALDEFTVENHSYPSPYESYLPNADEGEACQGTPWGRGCISLTGGIIQDTRGPVGRGGSYSTGNLKDYGYDACQSDIPPPYFPTTGVFREGKITVVDPTGFDIDAYWQKLAQQ